MVLLWTKLNSIHPRMLCAKFGWNWPSSSGEEDFLISSMYFRYFLIISPWKRAGPFIWTNLIPFTQECFVPSLVEIGPVVLEKKMKMWKVYRQTDRRTDGWTDRRGLLHLKSMRDTSRINTNITRGPWATLLAWGGFLHVFNIILQISYYLLVLLR